MKRTQWEFAYTADELLKAATAKKLWHEGRLKWWADKRDETEKKIKESGLEVDNSVAAGTEHYWSNKSTHRAPVVTINNDMLNDFQECIGKVNEHQNKVKDYDAWCQVLSSQGQHVLQLNQDDWLFFFGK